MCADRVSVGLSYDAFEMAYANVREICHAEQKYMPIFGTIGSFSRIHG